MGIAGFVWVGMWLVEEGCLGDEEEEEEEDDEEEEDEEWMVMALELALLLLVVLSLRSRVVSVSLPVVVGCSVGWSSTGSGVCSLSVTPSRASP